MPSYEGGENRGTLRRRKTAEVKRGRGFSRSVRRGGFLYDDETPGMRQIYGRWFHRVDFHTPEF